MYLEIPYKSFGITENPYITFINSIPYSFYCIFTILFVGYLIFSGRDYSNMLKAEKRVLIKGEIFSEGAQPLSNKEINKSENFLSVASHWTNAMLPICFLILTTLLGLYITGIDNLSNFDKNLGLSFPKF